MNDIHFENPFNWNWFCLYIGTIFGTVDKVSSWIGKWNLAIRVLGLEFIWVLESSLGAGVSELNLETGVVSNGIETNLNMDSILLLVEYELIQIIVYKKTL